MKNDDKTLGTLLARTLIVLCTVTLSGCFTAFTPARDFCTGDPKNTGLPLCSPEVIQKSMDWEQRQGTRR
jgi:hypothetical protein